MIACRSCGTRYRSDEPACPSCQRATPRATVARAAPARPRRDLAVFGVHLAMAASFLWPVVRFGRPIWAVSVAALELAIAASMFTRGREQGTLLLVRSAAFVIGAALLALAGSVNLLVFAVILAHVIAVLAAHRDPASDLPFLSGAFSGLRSGASVQDRAVRARAAADDRYFVRVAILTAAVASGLLLASIVQDAARAG